MGRRTGVILGLEVDFILMGDAESSNSLFLPLLLDDKLVEGTGS